MKKSLLGVSVIALTVAFVGSASAEGMMGAIQGSIMPKVDMPDMKMPDVEKPDVDSAINKFKEKLGMNKEETTEESQNEDEGSEEATEENSEDEGSEEATEENSAEGEKEEGDNDGDADDMPKKKSIWDYFKK